MKKAAGEPGLEVADFVVQAAGTQVRNTENGSKKKRMDFKAVFDEVDQGLVEYAQIKSGDIVRNPNGTINAVKIDPSFELVSPKPKQS